MMHPDNWKTLGNTVLINAQKWFYRYHRNSEAPTLLLLHGFPTSSYDWHKVWDDLAEHFTLIAPDFLGFGWSQKPYPYNYSIKQQAKGCQKLLEHIGVSTYHILAHDYGNTVTQELLAQFEEDPSVPTIESIIFLNGGLFPEMHYPRAIQKILAGPIGPFIAPLMTKKRFAKSMRNIFGPAYPPSSADIDAFWSLIKTNQGKRCIPLLLRYMQERKENRERWVPPILANRIPIRLINGPEDPISGRHLGEYYTQLKPSADVIFLEGVGHYPQIEAPDRVWQAVKAFFSLP